MSSVASSVEEHRQAMLDLKLDEMIDARLNALMLNAKTTMANPRTMKKLAPLIKYYAKFPHPFTKCVRDNRKRFGPLVNKYCAVIVDLIHGGDTSWRSGGKKKSVKASDDISTPPQIDDDVVALLDALPQPAIEELDRIYMDAMEVAAS